MAEVLPETSFNERIRIIIEKVGSAEKLATLSGMSSRVIGKYLAGESDPSREKLVALANAAGVSVAWLATGEKALSPEQPDFVCEHGPHYSAGIDESLLISIIEAIEEHLAAIDGELAPKKKAQLIATLYSIFNKEKAAVVDTSTVLRLVKLAV